MKKAISLFSGFAGASSGLRALGYRTIGVEIDPKIAHVAGSNGYDTIIADVTQISPSAVSTDAIDVIQASPVCKSFSRANTNGVEHDVDIASAHAVVRFLRHFMPRVFILENVPPYRHSKSFGIICDGLTELGYSFDRDNCVLNAADFGLAQTRERIVMLAVRGQHTIHKPRPTHAKTPNLFMQRWRGWFEVLADIIDEMPESRLAQWQIDRLPTEIDWRAIVLDGQTNSYGKSVTVRRYDEPMFSLTASMHKRPTRAWLLPGANASSFRARDAVEPAHTIADVTRVGNIARAIVPARVVKLTPRALARLQGFPDDYQLPDSQSLAVLGIGNAMPGAFVEAWKRYL